MDHHLYDNLRQTWVKQRSKSQPTITLNAEISKEDFAALGSPLTAHKRIQKRHQIIAIADTGCQSCLAGTNLLQALGHSISNLISVTTKMRSASGENIELLGATPICLSGTDTQGRKFSTRQMVYITDRSGPFFLSRAACTDLGIISDHFPKIGEAITLPTDTSAASSQNSQPAENLIMPSENTIAPCGCLRRTAPPPFPQPLVPVNEHNRLALERFLLETYSSSTFNTCPHQPMPQMSGPPMKLMINPDVVPVAHQHCIPIPLHFWHPVKEDLDRDVNLGVIEPVPAGTPLTWCHRMVIATKKDSTPRRTVDFQALNKHAVRETHHTPSPFHLARSVPNNKKKTTVDAWNGFHGLPLVVSDRHYTTFMTPWGRFRYRVAPQGYIASGDAYTKRYDDITIDVKNMVKCIDDTLLWANNVQDSFAQTIQYLDLCGRNGIVLNPKKFTFAANEVEFAGFEITMTNVRPCNRFLRAILDFPTPINLTDIRSWFGLVNQVSYTFSKADKMLPFRTLLKPSTKFEWTEELDKAFQISKKAIAEEIEHGVRIYDKSKVTCLATDWSKSGIGFWLFQKYCICTNIKPFCCPSGWKIALVGSRFTNPAESRYAPVEGEALAVVHALDKARYFVLGCTNLIVAVDHKPLLKLFGDRSLDEIPNSRLRNLKEKTLRYRFKMIHIPGVKHRVADGLSRHPVDPAETMELQDDMAAIPNQGPTIPKNSPQDMQANDITSDTEACILAAALGNFSSSPFTAVTWELVRTATASDEIFNRLLDLVESGFSEPSTATLQPLRIYYQHRDHLSTIDGVILYNDRVVVPPALRPNVLSTLHAAHQGVSGMIARAESSVFWPGITTDIKTMRDRCSHCNRIAPSNPGAPATPPMMPEYPFQCVCADYFSHKGKSYLVLVDRYSNWPIVEKVPDGSTGLITSLKRTFSTFGVPEELSSDGGPEFTAGATRKFLQDYGVHHRLSSVAFARSNGRAELGVKSMKRLLSDNTNYNGDLNTDAFQRAVLQYRNTPDRETRVSPAICVFGRQIRDFIPVLPGKYKPHNAWSETLQSRESALCHRHIKACDRLSEHTRRLSPLKIGDHVRIQNQTGPNPLKWDRTGIIIEVRQFDQYIVKIDGSNRSTLRNRKFLRKFIPMRTAQQPRSILLDIGPTLNTEQNQTPLKESDAQPLGQNITPESTFPLQPAIPVILENIPSDPPTMPTPEIHEDHPPGDPAPITNQLEPTPEETILRRSGRISRQPIYLRDFVT